MNLRIDKNSDKTITVSFNEAKATQVWGWGCKRDICDNKNGFMCYIEECGHQLEYKNDCN